MTGWREIRQSFLFDHQNRKAEGRALARLYGLARSLERLDCEAVTPNRFWHKADIGDRPPMSVYGTKRTSNCRSAMSAFGGKADIAISELHVRF
jgi:hypothetical protein